MSAVLNVVTASGSRYVLSDEGELTVTRPVDHPLGEAECWAGVDYELVERGGTRAMFTIPGHGAIVTSPLAEAHAPGSRTFLVEAFDAYADESHPCVNPWCDNTVAYDDEPMCFEHSPDSGSSVPGYSYAARHQG
jgi:hypothetical protein